MILVLAWVFDITDQGIERTKPLAEGGADPTAEEARPARSIAVLPFLSIGEEKENEYFCDGLAEDVLIRLSRVQGIRVAARSSAFAFKGRHDDVRVIGERLSVATVLEGTVRRSGDKVRITARLVNTEDGYELWSGAYDRQLDDIFKVQDEIFTSGCRCLPVQSGPGRGLRDPTARDDGEHRSIQALSHGTPSVSPAQ